jgi:hypothetical protein
MHVDLEEGQTVKVQSDENNLDIELQPTPSAPSRMAFKSTPTSIRTFRVITAGRNRFSVYSVHP